MSLIDNNCNIILIGSSTGGLPIVEFILKKINIEKFSVLIAQHMPEGFTEKWAERLDMQTPFEVSEAVQDDVVSPGRAFVAPGNKHLLLSSGYRLALSNDPHVNRFRPSIDVLFESALTYPMKKIFALILSGMGTDGVKGIIRLKEKGAVTIAQNEETSIVFGMNQKAIQEGGVSYVMSPDEMVEFFNRI